MIYYNLKEGQNTKYVSVIAHRLWQFELSKIKIADKKLNALLSMRSYRAHLIQCKFTKKS